MSKKPIITDEQANKVINEVIYGSGRPGGAMVILSALNDFVRKNLVKDIVITWERIKNQDNKE